VTSSSPPPGWRGRWSGSSSSFSNALAVSLFVLIPGIGPAWPTFSVAVAGLFFVAASVLSLIRLRYQHHAGPRDVFFLVSQSVLFVVQITAGLGAVGKSNDAGDTRTIAIVVIASFLIGIARAWELIGGPEIGLFHELTLLGRRGDSDRSE
jgi:hypothetical protein